MKIEFPYEGIAPLDIPDGRLMGVVGPRDARPTAPPTAIVSRALRNPIASPRLRDLACQVRRALILCDDNTRPTPIAQMLPWLLEELHENNSAIEIAFLIASGTHRPMTAQEKEQKLGAEALRGYPVFDHRWDDTSMLVDLGRTPLGAPVQVNRALLEADLIIGVGHVAPHRMAGFGGGGKIVQPGVCGAVTTGRTHWAAAQFATAELMGQAENAIRAEMNSVAAAAGLKAIVNVVLNTKNEIVGCFCGDPVAAHWAACQLAEQVYGGDLPGLADIVVIESYPGDLDLWQASKALAASEIAVKPHGVVILVAPCPEGVSCEHPTLLDYGYRSPAEVADWVRTGAMTDLVVAAELAIGGRVIRERAKGIMVSTGITTEAIRQLGLTPAATPQEALDMAFHLTGQDARVLVVRHGGEILPIVRAD